MIGGKAKTEAKTEGVRFSEVIGQEKTEAAPDALLSKLSSSCYLVFSAENCLILDSLDDPRRL